MYKATEKKRPREGERERERKRKRKREREREREREEEIEEERTSVRKKVTKKERERERGRDIERKKERDRERVREREKYRERETQRVECIYIYILMCGALPPTHGKQQPVVRIYVRAQTCRCFLSPRKQTRRLPSDASIGRSSPAAAEQESLASPVHSAAHAIL